MQESKIYKKNKNNNTFHASDVIFFECFIYHDHINLNLNQYNYLFHLMILLQLETTNNKGSSW